FAVAVSAPPLSSVLSLRAALPIFGALLDPLHRAADLAHELLVRCGLHLQTLNRRGRSRAILLRLRDQGPRRGRIARLRPRRLRRSEEHTSELQSRFDLVCRLLLEE